MIIPSIKLVISEPCQHSNSRCVCNNYYYHQSRNDTDSSGIC